ncbi:MAG: T9SS type A sorting domain-containing protein [Bacteroidota bacterium]
MKKILPLFFLFLPYFLSAQYLETFTTDGIGVAGVCGSSASSSCATNNITGSWTLTGDFLGLTTAGSDRVITSAGQLVVDDIDSVICWHSPTLDISTPATASLSVDLEWNSFDTGAGSTDFNFISVEYQVDGGGYTEIPNIISGSPAFRTVEGQLGQGEGTGTGTATASGIVGNTMDIRICFENNSASEDVFIDNVSVPEAGVTFPVEWGLLDIAQVDGYVQLEWTTLTESNNAKFNIMRSIDGMSWANVGSIKGAGNSTATQSYEFADYGTTIGKYFYRIQQVDFNGMYAFSNVLEIQVTERMALMSDAFPNPSKGQISTHLNVPEEGILTLQAYDLQGRLVWNHKDAYTVGRHRMELDWRGLAKGIYLLKAQLNQWQSQSYVMIE